MHDRARFNHHWHVEDGVVRRTAFTGLSPNRHAEFRAECYNETQSRRRESGTEGRALDCRRRV